jgi:hypothetical protein
MGFSSCLGEHYEEDPSRVTSGGARHVGAGAGCRLSERVAENGDSR